MKYLMLLILLLFISCNSNEIGGNDYTVIKYDSVEWNAILGNAKPTDLSIKEINEIEGIIGELAQKTIKSHNDELKQYYADYPDLTRDENSFNYSRQYVAGINENGEKVVWVNFFCGSTKTDDWKTKIKIVADGGNCNFNLKVNLTEKKYYDFIINGIANVEKPLHNNGS